MPNTCAAYGCNYRFGPDTKQKGITFHLLPPSTDVRRKLWISNSRRIDPVTRKPWDPQSKYVYFCSEHFMPSDFENTGKPFGRRLKDNAVPTVFTFPTVPDSPMKLSSSAVNSSGVQNSSTSDGTSAKGKVFSRTRKSKQRKVVMLPKKIKQLQENSPSNVESVTIISFQHLDYDEKLQPMFQEAMLDLQYPDDSEAEPEEEYFEDEYTELQNSVPPEEEEEEEDEAIPTSIDKSSNENSVHDTNEMDCSEGVKLGEGGEITIEAQNHTGVEKECSSVEGADNAAENVPPMTEEAGESNDDKAIDANAETEFDQDLRQEVQSSSSTVLTSQPMKVLQRDERTVVKRKIPVVIKEISVIDDIEELRTKAFRIAEDNIKLKKHVIYLEQKLEELVSQIK